MQELLSLGQVAAELGYGTEQIRELLRRRKIPEPCQRYAGNRRLWNREELEASRAILEREGYIKPRVGAVA